MIPPGLPSRSSSAQNSATQPISSQSPLSRPTTAPLSRCDENFPSLGHTLQIVTGYFQLRKCAVAKFDLAVQARAALTKEGEHKSVLMIEKIEENEKKIYESIEKCYVALRRLVPLIDESVLFHNHPGKGATDTMDMIYNDKLTKDDLVIPILAKVVSIFLDVDLAESQRTHTPLSRDRVFTKLMRVILGLEIKATEESMGIRQVGVDVNVAV